MAKHWCVWRTQREETEDYQGDEPMYSFADNFTDAVAAAQNRHRRDKADIENYGNSDAPEVQAIKNRKYCVYSCRSDDDCTCIDYAEDVLDGDIDAMENPANAHYEPLPPVKRFFRLF